MTFLRLLTWPYIRKHRLRTVLTLAGIVIGVAVFVGMHAANQNVVRAFQQTVDRIAGKAHLQISAGETGFPEEVLETVQAIRQVAAAAPVIEAVLRTAGPGEGNLLVLGVDMTGDRSLRDYDLEGQDDDAIEDPLVFLAQPDSLMLSKSFVERNGITRGQRLMLDTMEGPRQFTVRGIMKGDGLASAFSGNLAVMDIYAAQMIFGRGRMFDRIDVGVVPGTNVDDCRRAIEAALGPGFQVEPPANRGRHLESVSRGLRISIAISSLFALLIGVFIIYNSFSIAITQRRAEIGILRALGSSQRQVLGMFLAESAAAGTIGAVTGVLIGQLLARGITPVLSYLVREVYGTHQAADEVTLGWPLVIAALAVGIGTSMLGGFLPSLSAARVDPVKALQKGRYQVLSEGENRARRLAAAIFGSAAVACLVAGGGNLVFYSGYVFCILAMVFLTPAFALWLARALRPVLRWIRPVEGALAADSLIQAPRRTSATVSALMLSLALAIAFGGVANSIFQSVRDWMDAVLNPDLIISPSESLVARQFRFPAAMIRDLESVPGVAEVQVVRNARVQVRGAPAMLVAVDLAQVSRRIRMLTLEGDSREIIRLAREGTGVHISDSLARIRGFRVGERLELHTPTGPASFVITGRVTDFSDQQGTVFMDWSVYARYWKDDTASALRVYLKPGTSVDDARQRIQERFRGHRRMVIFTNQALRDFVLQLTEQWFGLTYVQLAVALLVAILGIVNTLTVSITDRRRELGVLQAVGALRGQIRHTIWMEALAIGLIGVILGAAMGAVTLYYNLGLVARDMAGLLLDYRYPFSFALALLPVILAAAFIASIGPAEAAVRASLVESLEYE
jgi:putative ABC transport system permease protein